MTLTTGTWWRPSSWW